MTIDAPTLTRNRSDKSRAKTAPSVRFLLHRAQQVAEDIWSKQKIKHGISPRQFDVLVAVETYQPCSQTRLVSASGVDRSTLAEILKRLARRSLIKRKRKNKDDAREQIVALTAAGSEAIRLGQRASAEVEAALNAPLSVGESADLADMLSRITVRSSE